MKTWAVCYRIKNGTGRTRESSKTFETRSAAETLVELIDRVGVPEALRLAALGATPRPIKGPTVADWVAGYIDHLTGVNRNTREDYRKYLEKDIAPALGGIGISELTREQVARWVTGMEGTHVSEDHRQQARAVVGGAQPRRRRRQDSHQRGEGHQGGAHRKPRTDRADPAPTRRG